MAKIQIDFDQVMRFGDLHGDIGRSLHSHRTAFRHDSARLDQIIDEFGLQRTTGSPHFQGLTVAAAMGDADARAGRVADSLIKTSSRIFNHAGSFRDDKFNWAGAAFGAVGVALIGPFGTALLGSMGGELAGAASSGLVLGRRVSPALGSLLPVFSGIVGVLDIVDGFSGLMDPYRDGWSTVSSGLKIASGGIGVVIGVIGVGLIVGLGIGAAPFFVVVASPFLAASFVLGVGALMIDERETVARIVSGAGRAATGAVRAAATTATEAAHDLLGAAYNLWDGAVGLVTSTRNAIVDTAFSGVEAIHSALKRATSEVGSQPWAPLAAGGVIGVLSPAAGVIAFALVTVARHCSDTGIPSAIGTGARNGSVSGGGEASRSLGTPPLEATVDPPDVTQSGQPGALTGSLPPSGGKDAYLAAMVFHSTTSAKFQVPPENGRLDQGGYAAENCTSWARFRRSQLGLSLPTGDGGEMGGSNPLVTPSLGAVVSWDNGKYGHVMIIEEILGPDQFRVSEMNVPGGSGAFRDTQVFTRQSDHSWKSSISGTSFSMTCLP